MPSACVFNTLFLFFWRDFFTLGVTLVSIVSVARLFLIWRDLFLFGATVFIERDF